jgi:hypothetical protein
MTTTALAQARNIVRQLSVQEKLYLLNDITAQLIQESAPSSSHPNAPFPVFHVAEWPTDLPTRREELYNDHGR